MIDRSCAGCAVRSYQTARAKQNAAKIPGNHHTDVYQVFGLQHAHHGLAGGTRRLAIITVAHQTGISPNYVRVTVMGSLRMLLPDAADESQGIFLGFYGHSLGEKPAFLHNVLILGKPQNCFIGLNLYCMIRRQ